jgi:DNA-binding IclR family transcriptional regulator
MGIAGPRSPAVHRGARVLDAISSGAADTAAALSALLGLPKSSIADLLGTLEDAGFIGRAADGSLHVGARWSDLSDPDALAHRLFRACATPDLDGYTVSLVQLFGNQVVFVDVHAGRHPLPLTPRPGQRADAADCAGAIAILSAMPAAEAANALSEAASHLGLSDDDVRRTLALRAARRRASYVTRSPHVGRQLACSVTGARLALTLHIPERWPEPLVRKAARALTAASEDY